MQNDDQSSIENILSFTPSQEDANVLQGNYIDIEDIRNLNGWTVAHELKSTLSEIHSGQETSQSLSQFFIFVQSMRVYTEAIAENIRDSKFYNHELGGPSNEDQKILEEVLKIDNLGDFLKNPSNTAQVNRFMDYLGDASKDFQIARNLLEARLAEIKDNISTETFDFIQLGVKGIRDSHFASETIAEYLRRGGNVELED